MMTLSISNGMCGKMEKKLTKSHAKAYQRSNDEEWRIKPYSDWHRTLDRNLYMLDVDFIEWRFKKGELVAVGVMEITRVDMDKEVTGKYLDSILHRYKIRDMQASASRKVASALNTNAYIVLFRYDCSEFWVYNLSNYTGWNHFDSYGMEKFLKDLN